MSIPKLKSRSQSELKELSSLNLDFGSGQSEQESSCVKENPTI